MIDWNSKLWWAGALCYANPVPPYSQPARRLEDQQSLPYRGHVMHAQDLNPLPRGGQDGPDRAGRAVGRRVADHLADESLPRNADQAADSPSRETAANVRNKARLCAAVLPKPIPGSRAMRSRAIPAATRASRRAASQANTSSTTSP